MSLRWCILRASKNVKKMTKPPKVQKPMQFKEVSKWYLGRSQGGSEVVYIEGVKKNVCSPAAEPPAGATASRLIEDGSNKRNSSVVRQPSPLRGRQRRGLSGTRTTNVILLQGRLSNVIN